MIKHCSGCFIPVFHNPKKRFPKKKLRELTCSVIEGYIWAFEQVCGFEGNFLSVSV